MLRDKVIHYEVLANQITGLMIGYVVTVFITFPMISTKAYSESTVGFTTTTIFFILSYIRTYTIRYIFKRIYDGIKV